MSDRENIIRDINAAIPRATREQLCRAIKTIDHEYLLPIAFTPKDNSFTIDSIAMSTMQLRAILEIVRI